MHAWCIRLRKRARGPGSCMNFDKRRSTILSLGTAFWLPIMALVASAKMASARRRRRSRQPTYSRGGRGRL